MRDGQNLRPDFPQKYRETLPPIPRFTLFGFVSSLYCWLTWKTWSVGTRGTSLNIETPGILHFCSTTDETKRKIESITLRILSVYFRCEIDVVNDVKIYTRASKGKKCWVHVLFWNSSVILLDYRMGLFGQTPQKTPKEQVCRIFMKDDLKYYQSSSAYR